jgi:ribA/ribD-fused uncharacterized protein
MNTSSNLPLTHRDLITAMASGFTPKWCFFWGHTPAKDGSVSKSCFSQWWDGHPFEHGGITYRTAEHFMMAGKARLFSDNETLAKILASGHPAETKKLGRLVRNFDATAWEAASWDIVVAGNLAKFSQHPGLRSFLLTTGDRILVEASPYDQVWGIGMAASDPSAGNPAQWKGQNLLGFALMTVRERLAISAPAP